MKITRWLEQILGSALVCCLAWGCGDPDQCFSDTDCGQCRLCISGACLPAPELCDDGVDNDCDGRTDEGCDPCEGVVCDRPPDSFCVDDLTLRVFDPEGTCRQGACAYDHQNVACELACLQESGSCLVCEGACEEGTSECIGGEVRTCLREALACPVWSAYQACETGFCADATQCGQCVPGEDVYVDQTATGDRSGQSFADALPSIQEGIDLAAACGATRVHVAQGTYTENVTLAPHVELLGGYPSGGGARDVFFHPTRIDGGGQGHTVVIPGGEGMVLDGFVIQGGNAAGPPPHDRGGGIHCHGDRNSPIIRNCVVVDNEAEHGGGISVSQSNPWIYHCHFLRNVARRDGGGIYYKAEHAYPAIINCVVSDNAAAGNGGGIHAGDYSNIVNTTIVDNRAGSVGGVFSSVYKPNIVNSVIWNNDGAQLVNFPNVSHCCVQGGHAGDSNIADDPRFEPDGYHLKTGSPCIGAGDPAAELLPDSDIDGEDRVQGNGVDIGADEFSDALIVYLPFEDDGGSTSDMSGNGYHATVQGATFMEGAGLGGSNAYQYAWSESDKMVVEHRENMAVSTGLTLGAWVRPFAWDNVYAGYNRFVSKYMEYHIRAVNGRAFFQIQGESSGYLAVSDVAVMELDRWHHVVGTFDGRRLALYVDGTLRGFHELPEPQAIVPTLQQPINVGECGGLAEGFTGIIDEVMVYRRALKRFEVEQAYRRDSR